MNEKKVELVEAFAIVRDGTNSHIVSVMIESSKIDGTEFFATYRYAKLDLTGDIKERIKEFQKLLKLVRSTKKKDIEKVQEEDLYGGSDML